MWRKDGPPTPPPPAPLGEVRTKGVASQEWEGANAERATIGRSITIKGEVRGEEDLLIQGRVDGSVDLKLNSVTVGSEGRVKANIIGRVVTVEGEVEGDLQAEEQVILTSTARVQGDLAAPRIVLENGATFRGVVDMGEARKKEKGKGPANPG